MSAQLSWALTNWRLGFFWLLQNCHPCPPRCMPYLINFTVYLIHDFPHHRLLVQLYTNCTFDCSRVLGRGVLVHTGLGAGSEKHNPRSSFSLITHWHFPALWDTSISDSCSLSGCVQRHVRRHSSCRPWLWLEGTAVCVNEAIATQTSEAAVPEQTSAPIRLHKAPGYVNNDLMRMRAITVINTAHIKLCQLSGVSGRSCVTLKRLACNDQRPSANIPNTAYTEHTHTQ